MVAGLKCKVQESFILNEDNGEKTSVYGLAFYTANDDSEGKDEIGEVIETIENIFTGNEQAKKLCSLINSEMIDRAHIHDIIEDALK